MCRVRKRLKKKWYNTTSSFNSKKKWRVYLKEKKTIEIKITQKKRFYEENSGVRIVQLFNNQYGLLFDDL